MTAGKKVKIGKTYKNVVTLLYSISLKTKQKNISCLILKISSSLVAQLSDKTITDVELNQ